MNDAERLLRGKHIVDLAGDFDQIDYTIERIHDLFKGSYYELRKLAERGRDADRLPALRKEFDRHYLALRDIVSGYLRLERAHDRLYELMGDDKVREAEAKRAAYRARAERERAAKETEEARRRQGFRSTHSAKVEPSPLDDTVRGQDALDATMQANFSAADVEAAVRDKDGGVELDWNMPTTMVSGQDIEAALKERGYD